MLPPLALQRIYPPNPSLEQFKSNLETLSHFNALNTTEHTHTYTHVGMYCRVHKSRKDWSARCAVTNNATDNIRLIFNNITQLWREGGRGREEEIKLVLIILTPSHAG